MIAPVIIGTEGVQYFEMLVDVLAYLGFFTVFMIVAYAKFHV